MGKPGKSAKAGKSGKSGKSGKGGRAHKLPRAMDIVEGCFKNVTWCAKYSDETLSEMSPDDLMKVNCGRQIDWKCDAEEKARMWQKCKEGWMQPPVTEERLQKCTKALVAIGTFTQCAYGHSLSDKEMRRKMKRAANLSGDASSSTAIWASVGVILFLLVSALLAWWYLKGDKKGAGRTAKGASKSVKSKSKMTGKSKLGSRKSLASKAGSRKGSHRSKVSQASKGSAKKSRRSGKKK